MIYKKVILYLLLIPLFLSGCAKEPIKIGFIAGLSGRQSQLGVSSREAVLIALNAQNKNGGINGRSIQLIIANDQNNPEIAIKEIENLVDEGVIAIIGPLTSNIIPAVNSILDRDVLVISPTISSSQLSNLDDNFIRVIPATDEQGRVLSDLMAKDSIKNTVVIYDISNLQYTDEVKNAFIKNFNAHDGVVLSVFGFNGTQPPDSISLADKIINSGTESAVLISCGNDAALIAQQLWKRKSNVSLYGSRWTKTDDLLKSGGKAVEGMKIVSEYIDNIPGNTSFDKTFRKRTGFEPSFSAIYSFETAEILFRALEQTKDLEILKVKQKIINNSYTGLYENFRIDENGDAFRTDAYSIITDGKFSTFKLND